MFPPLVRVDSIQRSAGIISDLTLRQRKTRFCDGVARSGSIFRYRAVDNVGNIGRRIILPSDVRTPFVPREVHYASRPSNVSASAFLPTATVRLNRASTKPRSIALRNARVTVLELAKNNAELFHAAYPGSSSTVWRYRRSLLVCARRIVRLLD